MKALGDAAAILRAAGDTVEAQALENRAHAIRKAQSSVGHATRLFLTARAIQRTEHEWSEQEAAAREDARLKELDKAYRLAKEETAGKRATGVAAAAAARIKKVEAEAAKKTAKQRAELRNKSSIYAAALGRRPGGKGLGVLAGPDTWRRQSSGREVAGGELQKVEKVAAN